jgi:hypothetical protein
MFTPLRFFVLLSVAAITAGSASARADASAGCNDREFLAQLDKLQDWNAIYAFVKRSLPNCPDDGMYAEGYSDVVVHAFAKHWSYMPQLVSILARDPGYEAFVLRHIDETTDPKELKNARQNATGRCPPDMERLCKKIATRAGEALKHL